MWTRRGLAVVLCTLLAAPSPAAAAGNGRAAVEKALAEQGEAEYAAGRFKQAAVLFHRAFEQRQDVGYLYSAGRAEQQAGLIDEAQATYATVLRLAPKGSEFARKARLYLDAIKAQRQPPPPAAPPPQPPAAPAPAPPTEQPQSAPSPGAVTPTASPAASATPTGAAAAPTPTGVAEHTPFAAAAAPAAAPVPSEDAPRAGWWFLAGGAALAVGGAGLAWSTWRDVRRLDEAVATAPAATKVQAAADYKAAAQQSKAPIVGGWVAAIVGVAASAYGFWSLRGSVDGPGVVVLPGPDAGAAVVVRF